MRKVISRSLLIMAIAMFAVAGCGSDVNLGSDAAVDTANTPDSGPAPICAPGDTRPCACPGGVSGAQACNDQRTGYTTCACPVIDAGTPPVDVMPVTCSPACSADQHCVGTTCVSNCMTACGIGETCTLTGQNGWRCLNLTPPPVDAGPALLCAPGDTRPCACPGGLVGAQACNMARDGFTTCVCPVIDAGTPPVDVMPIIDTPIVMDAGPVPVCYPGDTRVCACTGLGLVGAQMCNDLHTGYTTCVCPVIDAGTPPVDVMPPVDSGPAPICVLGDTRVCACPGGLIGAQACNDGRSGFNPCVCPTVDAGVSCPVNRADCDGSPTNGCEVDTRNDTLNCGTCGMLCPARPNAAGYCMSGRCDIACTAGFADCDGNPVNGCETNTRTNSESCGACGTRCDTRANTTTSCTAGTCAYACATGFADCNGSAGDGCETNTRTSNASCGACGHACAFGSVCSNGTCQLTCTPADGGVSLTACGTTCTNTQTDIDNCGACGTICAAHTATHATCVAGHCGDACNLGFGNCDSLTTNGCEVELYSNVNHCGACGNACTAPVGGHATPSCYYGYCDLTCASGFDNCNYDPGDGCEVNLQTDTRNCGTCGNRCPTGQSCTAGACVGPISPVCPIGRTDCRDPYFGTGPVCVNLANDRLNCGGCGFMCWASETCTSGSCIACPIGQTACSNTCVNTQSDTNNCGVCGNRCAMGQSCLSGACTMPIVCPTGTTLCGGACLNLSGDVMNCGACGRVCAAGQTCVSGACNALPVDAGTTDASVDVPAMSGHTLFVQNGSGVSDPDAGITIGSPTVQACRMTLVIETWDNSGTRLASPAGSSLSTAITPGIANVKLLCGITRVDLCAEARSGRRTAREIFGSDGVILVDGRAYALTNAPIATDPIGGGCAIEVAITEAPGSIPVGATLP